MTDDMYTLPADVIQRAKREDKEGKHYQVGPLEILEMVQIADKALNGNSNDAERDALLRVREYLANFFEGVAQ